MITRRDFLQQGSLTLLAMASMASVPVWMRAASSDSVVVETAFGKIRGVDIDGIKVFKGIPYGASTAGTNRWMPPAEPADWSGVRDAFAYGHSAPQQDPAAAPPAPGTLTISGASLPPEG